jgi:diacylglycerol kinase family enzyme
VQPPFYVLINFHSGHQDTSALMEQITTALQQTGREVNIIPLNKDQDIDQRCRETVLKAKAQNACVVAAGGDGTINTIAALCHEHQVVLGVIPLGTFNYFARELGTETVEQALEAITSGRITTVAAGFIQDHIFLNNASLGIYTTIIRNREKHKSIFGRMRLVAAVSALLTLFRGQPPFALKMVIDGKDVVRRTNLVFFGNSMVQLHNLGFDAPPQRFRRALALIIMKPMTRLQTAGLLIRGILKKLHDASRLEEFDVTHVEINSRRTHIHAVIDGEIIRCTLPLTIRIERVALQVMAPLPQPEIPA